ncbi:unnamed protein product [Sphagnum troendelagicum]|uniref:Uncharacterized protein n=1 Tax=Sphagnum troendelagicum TaxID=128251 RepID=A0ABP0U3Q7_9BRYO
MASIFATHRDSPRLPFLQHQQRRHEKEEAWFIFSRHNSLSLSLSLSFAIGLLTTVAEECVDISEQRAKCAVWRQEEDTCFNILCMIPVCKQRNAWLTHDDDQVVSQNDATNLDTCEMRWEAQMAGEAPVTKCKVQRDLIDKMMSVEPNADNVVWAQNFQQQQRMEDRCEETARRPTDLGNDLECNKSRAAM